MAQPNGIQSVFLEEVRAQLAPHLSLADELAEQLSISRDSAYRRIRGETVLSLDEVKILAAHYNVSLDALLSPSSELASFRLKALNASNFSFENWLKSLLEYLQMVGDGEIIWHAKDLPIFHYFQFPRLATFKIFFWIKSFMPNVRYASGKYHAGLVDKALLALSEKIWQKYSAASSSEIISHEVLNATLRQIQFANHCGMFDSKADAVGLCDDCLQLMDNLQRQAALGIKRTFGESDGGGKFELYLDEVLIGDNTVLLKTNGKRTTIITHNNFNLLITTQESFCTMTENHMNTMFSKSTLMSRTAEKERSRFFNEMLEKITTVKGRLE
jgi:hypothetical protein